jgi:hypothetical protein
MMTTTMNNESHVDRARRGPTPDNPSLSLKKRLKRAAFFDQRDRLAAEGKAVPVEADAGLPESLDDDSLMAHWSAGPEGEHSRPAA